MVMNINRSKWDILYTLLEFLELHKDVAQSRLANTIGLARQEKKKYFGLLQDKGYMTVDTEDHDTRTFAKCNITAKGLELRDNIKRVYDMFGGERPIW